MVLFGACVAFLLIGVGLGGIALWAVKLRPMDRRLAVAENKSEALAAELQNLANSTVAEIQSLTNSTWGVGDRVQRLEAIMRPEAGEFAPRVAVIERKQQVDTSTLVAHMKIFRRELDMFDERLIYMAKSPAFSASQPLPVASVDVDEDIATAVFSRVKAQ